ncbi:MAG: phosphodiester glycosidase family protein [Pyrinomonadaceae bacterium]
MNRISMEAVNLAKSLARACVFLSLCLCASVVNSLAQDWKPVADGVEYAQVRREFSGKPVNINLLRLDLKKVRLDVHHALDRAIGTEKTSSIATRHGAFAAINAGFFRLDTSIWAGDSAGLLKVDGELLSESVNNRVVLGITNGVKNTSVMFGHLLYRKALAYNDISRYMDGVNREPRQKELILFTPKMQTPLGEEEHTELMLEECAGVCKRVTVLQTRGGTISPERGYIIVSGKDADKSYLVDYFNRVGNAPAKYSTFLFDVVQRADKMGRLEERFNKKVEDITNGVPQLIKNGKIDITWEREKASKSFVETRHPRTAVAKLKDGKFLMLTADGRSEQTAGLDLYDLAKYMLELGAVDAMNLDGGGPTTMFLDGKVVNRPSDKEGERKVGDAILVTLRKKLQKPAR